MKPEEWQDVNELYEEERGSLDVKMLALNEGGRKLFGT